MTAYFQVFPKIFYSLEGKTPYNPKIVTNILARTKIIDSIKNNTVIYYTYNVKDADTPWIISYKYYGTVDRWWVIMLTNNMIDPYYDWPMNDEQFESFIIGKYGSVASAKAQVSHYLKTVTKVDSSSGEITTFNYIIDQTTYSSLPASSFQTVNLSNGNSVEITTTTSIVFVYDDEFNKNDAKRIIKVIDKNFVGQIERELKSLMSL